MASIKMFHYISLCRLTAGLIAVLGVCYGCCVPKAFFGPVRVVRTTVAPGMPDTSVELFLNAYDAANKRVAVAFPVGYQNTIYTRHIFDFGKGIHLVTTGEWYGPGNSHTKCAKYPLHATWREACVPENATKSEGFYMGHQTQQYYRQLDAVAFTYTQGSTKAKVMVTQDTCFPVGEVIYDTGDPAGARVINRLYVNQTTDANDGFFQPPVNVTCVPNPNPLPMTQWQRVAFLGWMLGLQQQ